MNNLNVYIEEKTERLLVDARCYELPINLEKCAAYIGITLKPMELDEDVSGFLLLKDDSAHIGYNKTNSKQRKRFTIAHEIGHYLLHANFSKLFVDKNVKILFRNSESSTGELIKEREANAFAASLLMPKKLIVDEVRKLDEENINNFISKLSKRFDVSEQAITIRLTNLGLIDYSEFAA